MPTWLWALVAIYCVPGLVYGVVSWLGSSATELHPIWDAIKHGLLWPKYLFFFE